MVQEGLPDVECGRPFCNFSEDLQLLFSDYQVVYDSESLFLFPEKISYTKFASYNKLKKQYTRDYVYSGVFAEYRINKKE